MMAAHPATAKSTRLRLTERLRLAIGHNLLDPLFKIGPGNARNANERRLQIKSANRNNPSRVNLRIAACAQHGLIAGALALFYKPRAEPIDQGMKPEDGLHRHVNRAREVVVAPHVA